MPRGRPPKRVSMNRQQARPYSRAHLNTSGSNTMFPCTNTPGAIIQDILKCTQCLETAQSAPIFQCEDGHILCTYCYPRVNSCPICSKTLNLRIRCLIAEMLIARLPSLNRLPRAVTEEVENEDRTNFENVTQKIMWVEEKDKRDYLIELLDAAGLRQRNRSLNAGLTLVFVELGSESADELEEYLYQQGFLLTSWLDGHKTQQQKEESLGNGCSQNSLIARHYVL